MKKLLLILIAFFQVNLYSFEYIKKYDTNFDKVINFNGVYQDNIWQNFLFLKRNTNLRTKPSTSSEIITTLKKGDKIEVIGLVKNNDGARWYEVIYGDKIGYIYSNNAIKRQFDINKAIRELEIFNDFLKKYNDKLVIAINYTPLNNDSGEIDKLNNSGNQSVIAYTDTTFYNIPDRSILAKIGEDSDYIYLISPIYEEVLKVSINDSNRIKRRKLDEINKLIYIDRHSQTQISLEKLSDDEYNIVAMGYVTTGVNSVNAYITPYGNFLVDISKRIMPYTDSQTNEIIGSAPYAIRFSGGAYLHGIPAEFEPEDTYEQRKKKIEDKLGTYPLSKKCVRNNDDIIKYIYDWIGEKSVDKLGKRTPETPVLVIVR